MKTPVEGDLFGGSGGDFRLRHAYGGLGGLPAGQTWTNCMPIESYPGTVDFQGPAGSPFVREAQLRYTRDAGNGFQVSASVENDPSGDSTPVAGTAAASYTFDRGGVELAGISRKLKGATQNVAGVGFNLSANASLWEGGTLQASYISGEANGSHMVFGRADVICDTAVETEAITLDVSPKFNDALTASVAYGLREIDQGVATNTSEPETVHVSLLYTPVERVTMGLEFITGERTLFDNTTACADRIQGSVQYNF